MSRHLIFSLIFMLLLPLGSSHVETLSKNETERTETLYEYYKAIERRATDHSLPKYDQFQLPNFYVASFYNYITVHLEQKIYILHLELLI
jgi:hypothetical protein